MNSIYECICPGCVLHLKPVSSSQLMGFTSFILIFRLNQLRDNWRVDIFSCPVFMAMRPTTRTLNNIFLSRLLFSLILFVAVDLSDFPQEQMLLKVNHIIWEDGASNQDIGSFFNPGNISHWAPTKFHRSLCREFVFYFHEPGALAHLQGSTK